MKFSGEELYDNIYADMNPVSDTCAGPHQCQGDEAEDYNLGNPGKTRIKEIPQDCLNKTQCNRKGQEYDGHPLLKDIDYSVDLHG